MKTENFSLIGAGAVFMRQGIIRVLRYDEGDAGGPVPLIRVTSMSGSDVDVEMKPGRIINLKEPINGLVIRNLSGANLTGKFTWGDGSVEDNAFSGIFDLTAATINALINAKYNTRPEAATGYHNSTGAVAVNTAVQVFSEASNTGGVLLLSCDVSDSGANYLRMALLAKAGAAPATMQDGEPVLVAGPIYSANSNPTTLRASLQESQLIPAGLGLFFISDTGVSAGCTKAVRWRNL